MSINYAGVATNHANIPTPEGIDIPAHSDVADPVMRLLDIDRHSQARLTALEALLDSLKTQVPGNPGTADVWVPVSIPHPVLNDSSRFSNTAGTWEQTSVVSAGSLVWNITLPYTVGRLKGVRAYVQGGAGSGFGTRPDLTLALYDPATASSVQANTTADPAASSAAFQAAHVHETLITAAAFGGARYPRITLTGEGGGLAVVGYRVRGLALLIGP